MLGLLGGLVEGVRSGAMMKRDTFSYGLDGADWCAGV